MTPGLGTVSLVDGQWHFGSHMGVLQYIYGCLVKPILDADQGSGILAFYSNIWLFISRNIYE